MKNRKLNPKRFSLQQIPDFLKLYFAQLGIAVFVWFINNLFLKEIVTEIVQTAVEDFPALVIYTEPWYQILMKSVLVISIIYALIFIIGTLTRPLISNIFYLILALGVALLAGTAFSGGILTYNWGNGVFQFIISQLEWFGGALIVTGDKDRCISGKSLLVGFFVILTSIILRVLIF